MNTKKVEEFYLVLSLFSLNSMLQWQRNLSLDNRRQVDNSYYLQRTHGSRSFLIPLVSKHCDNGGNKKRNYTECKEVSSRKLCYS